jgi:predicted kinase
MALKELQQIQHANPYNAVHKRHKHNFKQIRQILHNSTVLRLQKADNGKMVVISSNDALQQKVQQFLHRIATFDIKDLYVKLPTHDIKLATRYWLSKRHTHPTVIHQTVNAHGYRTESELFSIRLLFL